MSRQTKSAAIASCIEIAAHHFGVDPNKVYLAMQVRCKKQRMARAAVWWHLHRCGMSPEAIGRAWMRKSVECVTGENGLELASKFTDADWQMMATMPRIETTLEIARA